MLTLIFNFTFGLLSICCSIFFAVFIQPLLLGKKVFLQLSPPARQFLAFYLLSHFKATQIDVSVFRQLFAETDLQLPRGLSLTLVVYRGMPKTKSRQLIHVKRYQSLAGSPGTRFLLQSRSFSKIESVKSSLLIAEIHLLLRSAVLNLSKLFFG